eukprot:superscaffoldBa00005261_g20110
MLHLRYLDLEAVGFVHLLHEAALQAASVDPYLSEGDMHAVTFQQGFADLLSRIRTDTPYAVMSPLARLRVLRPCWIYLDARRTRQPDEATDRCVLFLTPSTSLHPEKKQISEEFNHLSTKSTHSRHVHRHNICHPVDTLIH